MLDIRIKNILIHQDYNSLLASKDKFIWRHPNGQDEYDGPTMLYLLLQKIKPYKLVLARKYKHNLRNATSAQFNHNIQHLIYYMRTQYNSIIDQGGSHDDYLYDIFTSLQTSSNSNFNDWIGRLLDDWESDVPTDSDKLTTISITKYTNMKAVGT